MRRRELLRGFGAGLAVASLPACGRTVTVPGPIIQTDRGRVRGEIVEGVHRFLGVPYAEPPFGQNRFLAPVVRSPWDGVLEASQYGRICPQTGGLAAGSEAEGEDCLNLNLWTPDPAAKGLPVMVWAHGGGQVTGSGTEATYDGTHFARDGVVLITCNRRLGAEGYLYLEEHFGDGIGPGNLGILDQIEVLKWVQRNVARFGGDPGNVTLFGESGGGATTQAVVATTASKGLLHRVIPQSGGHAAQRPDTAKAIADLALERVGVRPGELEALQQLPWQKFVEVYDELQATSLGRPQIYLPVIGETMPVHPVDAAHAGVGAELDYLIGTCRDEMNLFSAFGDAALAGFQRRRQTMLDAAGIEDAALVRAYQNARPELDEEAVELAILGDMWFRVPSIRIAEGHAARQSGRTHMYLFTWESNLLGAAHAMDLVVFGNGLPFPGLAGFADYDQVAAQMRASWINFARNGDPSTGGIDWPQYETQRRSTMAIDDSFRLLEDPFQRQRDALGDLLTMSWQNSNL
jgi:para-nitrobenzyl esterase